MTTTTQTPTERISAAMETYLTCERELAAFVEEWFPVIEKREALAEQLALAKRELTEAMAEPDISYAENADVEVLLIRQNRGAYNADRLPKRAEVLDHCTLSIATSEVKKLVKRGLLTDDEAQAAWEAKASAPYIKVTPKVIEG